TPGPAAASLAAPRDADAASSAALRISASGMASKVSAPTSNVRHSAPPQAEQQVLLPTLALSQSSIERPAIQIRLDSDGIPLNASSAISRASRTGSMPNG